MTENKLKGHRVYLVGAMDRVPDRGSNWREQITPLLEKLGLFVLNPLSKPTTNGIENEDTSEYKHYLKQDEKYDDLSRLMREIRSVDLRMVDISDFLIVNLDLDTHPCGTYEEIFWANRQKKPILIRMKQGKQQAPDWLFGTIPHEFIFDTWGDLYYYIKNINRNTEIKTFDRWCFFNYES